MRHGRWIATLAALTLLAPVAAFGWGDGGHEMVAAIAFSRLNASAKKEAGRLLEVKITPTGRSESADPAKRFMHASHWADDVKDDLPATRDEHFVDFPFSPDHTKLPKLPKDVNILRAMMTHVHTLQSSSDDVAKAKALRFLIHFVGDVHQPLHCSTRVTKAHPQGDRGGNDFTVKPKDAAGHPHAKKLHGYWDGALDTFPKQGRPGDPFAPPPDAEVDAAVVVVLNANPDTDSEISEGGPLNFQGWADESKVLARTVAYNIKPNATPSSAYIKDGVKTARKRVAWAGYRLAALLNEIWK